MFDSSQSFKDNMIDIVNAKYRVTVQHFCGRAINSKVHYLTLTSQQEMLVIWLIIYIKLKTS